MADIGSDHSGNFLTTVGLWTIAICSYAMSHMVSLLSMPEIFIFIFEWILKFMAFLSLGLTISVNWKRGKAQIKEWLKIK
jgi:hypothetical protein